HHRLQPVQHLQAKEKYEEDAKPWMQSSGKRASAKNWREPTEQPGQVNSEAREECEKEEESDHPVQETRVHGMPPQLAYIYHRAADGLERTARVFVEPVKRRGHSFPLSVAARAGPGAGLRSHSAKAHPSLRIGRGCPVQV